MKWIQVAREALLYIVQGITFSNAVTSDQDQKDDNRIL